MLCFVFGFSLCFVLLLFFAGWGWGPIIPAIPTSWKGSLLRCTDIFSQSSVPSQKFVEKYFENFILLWRNAYSLQ